MQRSLGYGNHWKTTKLTVDSAIARDLSCIVDRKRRRQVVPPVIGDEQQMGPAATHRTLPAPRPVPSTRSVKPPCRNRPRISNTIPLSPMANLCRADTSGHSRAPATVGVCISVATMQAGAVAFQPSAVSCQLLLVPREHPRVLGHEARQATSAAGHAILSEPRLPLS